MKYEEIIKKGLFEELDNINSEEKLNKIRTAAINLGINEENISAYYSCIYMTNTDISCREKAKFYDAASTILTTGLTYVTDAYALGYFHIKKAIELDPTNINYKQTALMVFADIPDYDMDKVEIKKIAEDILKINPNDPIGLKYYKKIN